MSQRTRFNPRETSQRISSPQNSRLRERGSGGVPLRSTSSQLPGTSRSSQQQSQSTQRIQELNVPLMMQAMFMKKCLSPAEMKELIAQCSSGSRELSRPSDIEEALGPINRVIKPFYMEIRSGINDYTRREGDEGVYFALVPTVKNEISKLAQIHTTKELEVLKKILKLIANESQFRGCIPKMSAVNVIQGNSIPGFKIDNVENLIDHWIREKYLIECDLDDDNEFRSQRGSGGYLGLGVRSLIEFRQFVTSDLKVPVESASCQFCKNMCIHGKFCQNCDSKYHVICIPGLSNKKCVKCKREFIERDPTESLPDADEDEEDHSESLGSVPEVPSESDEEPAPPRRKRRARLQDD